MAVVFDCASDIAMFRKPYTTTSSVSFAFPPPTAVAGLIAAVIGLENGAEKRSDTAAYWEGLPGTQIAVAIRKPLKWLRASLNFWNVKNPAKAPHIQVKHQFVSFPEYRIYVRGGVEEKLSEKLKNGEFIYTPFLGTAYAIASLKYVGSCNDVDVAETSVSLSSMLPFRDGDGIKVDFAAGQKVFKERVPFEFSKDRKFQCSITVLYSDSSKTLNLKERGNADVSRCFDETVAWFPKW